MQAAEAVIRSVFQQKMEEIKNDILAGRLTIRNAPAEMPEEMLDILALNCVLLLLAEEARWN